MSTVGGSLTIVHGGELSWWQRFLSYLLRQGPIPSHVAFIMDGNRRYARRKGLRTEMGHEFGFVKLTMALRWCSHIGIKEVSAFALSVQNFNRSETEVSALMNIARRKFSDLNLELLSEHGVCIRFFGNLTLLPSDIQKLMAEIVMKTKDNNSLFLNLCVAYTSKDEMIRAVDNISRAIQEQTLKVEDISEKLIMETLDTGVSSYPDMVIRTSGETRLSDFMMLQTSFSFLYFDNVLWPDYSFWNLVRAIMTYQIHYNTLQTMHPVLDGGNLSALSQVLCKTSEYHLRRRAAELLWKAHFEQSSSCWLQRLPEASAGFVFLLNRNSSMVLCVQGAEHWQDIDFILIAGFITVAPIELIASDNESCFISNLYNKLCGVTIQGRSGNHGSILSAIEACLRRALKNSQAECVERFKRLICEQNEREQLYLILRCFWDSDYPGVADTCNRLFGLWIEIYSIIRADRIAMMRTQLLQYYMNDFPWYCRGKYRVLTTLMTRCSTEEINAVFAQLEACLTAAMHSSQIAPIASRLWKIVVSRCPDKLNRLVALLERLICDVDKKVCTFVDKHWLPVLAKVAYHSLEPLLDNLLAQNNLWERQEEVAIDVGLLSAFHDVTVINTDDHTSLYDARLRAVAVILKHLYKFAPVSSKTQLGKRRWPLLQQLCNSSSAAVRIQCFEVLCRYCPKEEMTDDLHIDYVHKFLLKNLPVADSAFRISLCAAYRAYLSALKVVNGGRLETPFVHLVQVLMNNLFPGANYQRYSTCLNLLNILLEGSEVAKSVWTRQLDMDRINTLIRCVLHSCSDVRQLAAAILIDHCDCLQHSLPSSYLLNCVQIALDKLSSDTLVECEAGSVLLSCLPLSNVDMMHRTMSEHFEAVQPTTELFLFKTLFQALPESLMDSSVHLFGNLRYCSNLWHRVENILPNAYPASLLDALSMYVSALLGRLGSSDTEECPSLPQMHCSVGVVLAQNEALLPLPVKAILWDVTESCHLLLKLAGTFLKKGSMAELQVISYIFFDVLTRNRSVIIHDEAEKYLSNFCIQCFQSDWSRAEEIPFHLANHALGKLAESCTVSITRRAGGYSFLFNCLASTAARFNKTSLVIFILDQLIRIADTHVDDALGSCMADNPLVRALHCLRIVTLCSECRCYVRCYLPRLFRLASGHFVDAAWTVRNSAFMLLAAIVRNLFPLCAAGQDVVQFWAEFSEIWLHSLALLKNAVESSEIEMSIFPALAILNNLTVINSQSTGIEDLDKQLHHGRRALLRLLVTSASWKVRRLVASTIVNMIPSDKHQVVANRIGKYVECCNLTPYARGAIFKLLEMFGVHVPLPYKANAYQILAERLVTRDGPQEPSLDILLENCRGRHGTSMQALSLPLVTRIMLRDDGNLFHQWSECVLLSSANLYEERCRYAAAVSLTMAGRLVLFFSHDSAQCCKLVLAMCSLLCDENEKIRATVCQVTNCISDNQASMSYCDALSVILQHVARLKECVPLAENLMDALLPDVYSPLPNVVAALGDSLTYEEEYLINLARCNFLVTYASMHWTSFAVVAKAKVTPDWTSKFVQRCQELNRLVQWPMFDALFSTVTRFKLSMLLFEHCGLVERQKTNELLAGFKLVLELDSLLHYTK